MHRGRFWVAWQGDERITYISVISGCCWFTKLDAMLLDAYYCHYRAEICVLCRCQAYNYGHLPLCRHLVGSVQLGGVRATWLLAVLPLALAVFPPSFKYADNSNLETRDSFKP